MVASKPVPPGCCPGCLLEHKTEPCAMHRAAGVLLDALRECVAWMDAPHRATPLQAAILRSAYQAIEQASAPLGRAGGAL